jgi:hypothetical protein
VAEGEGFEPSRRCYRLRDFQSRALGQAMRPFQRRRGWDSNPRRLNTSPLFESGTFNHSDTSPRGSIPTTLHPQRGDNKTARVFRAVFGGTPGRNRTCGLWVRNPTLYPLSYRRVTLILHQILLGSPRRADLAGREGFEPSEDFISPQPLSRRPHSTTLAPPRADQFTPGRRRAVHNDPG